MCKWKGCSGLYGGEFGFKFRDIVINPSTLRARLIGQEVPKYYDLKSSSKIWKSQERAWRCAVLVTFYVWSIICFRPPFTTSMPLRASNWTFFIFFLSFITLDSHFAARTIRQGLLFSSNFSPHLTPLDAFSSHSICVTNRAAREGWAVKSY